MSFLNSLIVTMYDMLAPCGYSCLGSVAVASRTERPDLSKYCCVNNEYLTQAGNEFVWSNKGNPALRESSIWWNSVKPGSSGIFAGNFAAVTGHGTPYDWLPYILSSTRVKPYLHYMFGDWGRYSQCSADCGWGEKQRTRVCQQMNFITMQTMQTDLDPKLCIDANEGLKGVEEVFCKIKDCKPCEFGVAELGAFKWETIIDTKIVPQQTPYESTYRYMAASENSCGNACGSVAGCTGFIWADTKCDLIMGPFVTDDNAPGPLVTVGKLSEYCGEKFYQDVIQTSSFTINLPGYAAYMKDLIDFIMQEEVNSEDGAGKWRFREEDRVFYSVFKYYDSEGDNLISTRKRFVREKVGSAFEENRRKRREVPQNNIPQLPADVEVGEIGEPTVTTSILSENGDTIGTCDENEICTCIDGFELIGKKSCDDKDECENEKESICGGAIAGTCINIAGSFECYCNTGFHKQNGTCLDIDECDQNDNCNINGFECENTEGSFICVCQAGFESVSTIGPNGIITECIWPEWSEWSEWSNNCNRDVGPGLRQRQRWQISGISHPTKKSQSRDSDIPGILSSEIPGFSKIYRDIPNTKNPNF